MMDNNVCSLRMRLLLFLLPLLLACGLATTANAQIVQLANESFKKSLPQGWSVYPASTPTAPTWASDTHVTASGKYAMHGYVPYNAGDTVELVTPFYDCSNYKHVQLHFKHICKVLGSDLCQIFYREDNLSSQWRPIPADAYKGESKSYKANLAFDHASYTEWKSADTFAIPTTDWYREEVFDMSDYAGYSTVAFKFVIKKGTYFGSFIADGWYLDDFLLEGSQYILEPPYVRILTNDTVVYHTGPFTISAEIKSLSGAPIMEAMLYYKTDALSDSLPLKNVAGDNWVATIPRQAVGTVVRCRVFCMDSINLSSADSSIFHVRDSLFTSDGGNSAAIVNVTLPLKYALPGSQQAVSVNCRNMGSNALRNLQINWTVNRVSYPPVVWTSQNGSCDYGTLFNAAVGSFVKGPGTDTLVIWISLPNNVPDSVTVDDTLTYLVHACNGSLSGSYTVGKGGIYDFQNLEDACARLSGCGMKGDVRLLVSDGYYTGNLNFLSLSSNYKVTVASLSGHADSVVFYAPNGNAVNINSSSNLRFENITFSAGADANHVVMFSGVCDNVVFRNCVFNGQKKMMGNNPDYASVYFDSHGGWSFGSVSFIKNRFYYGTYGIYAYGVQKIFIDSNLFDGYFYTAVELRSYLSNSTFRHNVMLQGEVSHTVFMGAYFYHCGQLLIDGNTLKTKGSADTQYGIRVDYGDSSVVVCNNEIVIQSRNGNAYGIYSYFNFEMPVVNNGVFICGNSNAAQYGIYVSSNSGSKTSYDTTRWMIVRNNLIVIDSGIATAYPLFISNVANIKAFDMDYNMLYGKSNLYGFDVAYRGFANAIEYETVSFATVESCISYLKSNLNISTPLFQHDCSCYPVFADLQHDNLRLRNHFNMMCPAYKAVIADKEGNARTSQTVKGCYAMPYDSANLSLAEVLHWPENSYIYDTLHPAVVLMNEGSAIVTSADICWELDGVVRQTVRWKGSLAFGKTDTVTLSANVVLLPGYHTIKAYLVARQPNDYTTDDTLKKVTHTCAAVFSGNFTVGDTGFFANLDEALSALDECGMGGNVTLQMLPGKYYLNTVIPYLTGMDSAHVLHITSLKGDSSSVVLRRADSNGTVANAAPLVVNGAKYLKISHLTLDGMALNDTVTNCAHALVITGNSSHVEVKNCRLLLPEYLKGSGDYDEVAGVFQVKLGQSDFVKDNGSANFALAYLQGDISDVVISCNTMQGGVCAFHVEGKNKNDRLADVEISHNVIRGVDYGVGQIVYANNCILADNQVIQRAQGRSTKGFAINTGYSKLRVEGNVFHYGALGTAIVGQYADVDVVNNEIKGGNHGIYLGKSANFNILHNSIYVNTNAFTIIQPAGGGNPQMWMIFYAPGNSKLYNNIFHVKNGNVYADGSKQWTRYLSYGFNCYYNDATGTANLIGLSVDKTSVSIQPVYGDTTVGLSVINYPNLLCDILSEVPYDIRGSVRRNPTVMGAYDVNGAIYDVALLEMLGVSSLTATTSNPLGVIVKNYSGKPVDTLGISFYVNKVRKLRMTWRPGTPLAGNGATDTVWLGNFVLQKGLNELVAIVNYAADSLSYNDTARWSGYVCSGPLAGNYTVSGKNADFETVEDMQLALYTCGVSQNAVFRFRPGTYGGLGFTGAIPGSDSCSITFISDSGVVVFDGGTDGIGMSLSNVTNMTFRGLTFGNRKDGQIGVKLSGGCSNVTFRGCDICASVTATKTAYRAVDYASSSSSTVYPVNVRFIGNRISGGYYNMYLYYLAGKSGQMAHSSLYIDSNELTDACQYGIYARSYANIPSISYNRIESRAAQNGSDYYGIYTSENNSHNLIHGNRMRVHCGGIGYGMWFGTYINRYNSQSRLVINNEIIVTGDTTQYGIYFSAQNSWMDFHHNSVYVNSHNDKAYGLSLVAGTTVAGYTHPFTRNLVAAYGERPYPLFVDGDVQFAGVSYGLREWNNWYANDTIASVAGVSCQGIADLQAASKDNDLNSIAYNPSFKDTTAGLELKKYDFFACPMLADVPYDINGYPRSPFTSMGAYGCEIHDMVNLEMIGIISPRVAKDVSCFLEDMPVRITYRNSGILAAMFDSSALKVDMDVTGSINFHWDTVINSGILVSGKIDTLSLCNMPVMSSGTYNIKVTLKDSMDTYSKDDTLSTVYTVNWINPPYDVNFTTTPAELISVDLSGSIGWKVVSGTGTAPAVAPAFGTGRLEFAGAGNPGASANAVFNGVNLKGCLNPTLSFWYAHDADDSKRDLMFVLATTDGGASYTEIGRITAAAAATGWQQYDIDLSRFANEPCLSIVFQAISFGGANQSLDRIRITADADAALTLLPVDFTAFTACENDAVPLKVVVSNITAMPVEYSSDTIRATVTGASNQGFTCVYSKSLVGYESDTITLGSMDLRSNGNYYINVSMQSQDDNAQNDTASDSTILIRQDIALDSIVGIDAQTQHPGGDTVYVSALLRNNCNMAVDRFTVTMELNGETVVTDTVLRHMEAGDSIIHAVSMPYVVPFGTKEQPYYFLELSASIPCDGDANNDSRSVVGVIAVPDTVDLQVLSIAQPATDSGRVKVSPKVTVANIGNAEVQNVMLHVDVLDSAMTQLETVSEYINFINTNDTVEYAFSLTYTVPNYDGSYYLKAYVDRYADEINTTNDTLVSQFSCRRNATGIADYVAAGWSVGQNEPNPASGVTVIPFVIPEDAEVALTIMGVNGQLLHREIVAATAGANRVTLHTGTLPSGLYYYGVEYKGQRIVRKMNVVR